MPAPDYTSDGVISSIKRRITLPDAQNLFTPEALIAFMGDELSSTIEPLVHSVQQEYWVITHDVPLVQNQTSYTIPVRGIANGLRLITLVDNQGNEMEFPLLRPEYTASAYSWLSPYTTAVLCGFIIEDDHIVVFPKTVVANPVMSIRFRYERQPSQLCSTDDAARIESINGNVVTVNNIPSDWTPDMLFDITKGTPAFPSRGDDLTISTINIGALELTFAALPASVTIGDWVSIANTSPIPQIPYQLFPYLAQCVAVLCLQSLDEEELERAEKKLNIMKEDIQKLLQPRDMGNVQTIVNRSGLFENGAYWGWNNQSGIGF